MTSKDKQPPADDVAFECALDDPPEKVWRALTEPDLVAAWLAPSDIKADAGARFTLTKGAPDRRDVDCEVLEAEPPNRLSYRWSVAADARRLDSVVTFTLRKTKNGGTHLRIDHDRFALRAANDSSLTARERDLKARRLSSLRPSASLMRMAA